VSKLGHHILKSAPHMLQRFPWLQFAETDLPLGDVIDSWLRHFMSRGDRSLETFDEYLNFLAAIESMAGTQRKYNFSFLSESASSQMNLFMPLRGESTRGKFLLQFLWIRLWT
jgi:hypothetical protein